MGDGSDWPFDQGPNVAAITVRAYSKAHRSCTSRTTPTITAGNSGMVASPTRARAASSACITCSRSTRLSGRSPICRPAGLHGENR